MLRFVTESPGRGGRITRREWLRIGGFGAACSLWPRPDVPLWGRQDSKSPPIPGFGRARSVIVVFASGGQSQFETWDPKPHAPREVRGEFAAIPTSVPGTFICEHMPRLAQLAHRYCIVRSMSHADLDHGSAVYLSLTGRYHRRLSSNPDPAADDEPCHGAILTRIRPTRRFVATAVHVNGPAQVPEKIAPGQFAGFLGTEYEPMQVGDVSSGPVALPGLTPLEALPPVRLDARKTLLETLESYRRELHRSRPMTTMSQLYQRAFAMLEDPTTRHAFDLSAEPASLRQRYGRNRSGQACLLARRLVQAGVPFITVIFNHTNRGQDRDPKQADLYGWDTHNDIFLAMREYLLPRFDQAFSALLEDLHERGLLDETLVVAMGEFGRAPLVALEPRFAGASPGRKHWAAVYSIVFAGAGVRGGTVVGRSDRRGAYPASEKYGPWDVQATMFSALGIDPAMRYSDATGRSIPVSNGRPINALYEG